MKALKEYFTLGRVRILSLLILAVYMVLLGNFTAALVCIVILELRDINESLRVDK